MPRSTNGVGTFNATLKTIGSRTLTATDTVTASITGTSATIIVDAGAAATITATAGTPQSDDRESGVRYAAASHGARWGQTIRWPA